MRPEILIAISLINLALVDAYLLRAVRDLQGTFGKLVRMLREDGINV